VCHRVRKVATWFRVVLGAHACCETHLCITSTEMSDSGIAPKKGMSRVKCARSLDWLEGLCWGRTDFPAFHKLSKCDCVLRTVRGGINFSQARLQSSMCKAFRRVVFKRAENFRTMTAMDGVVWSNFVFQPATNPYLLALAPQG